ncbi:MAG: hypothetical protein AAF333_07810 [Planctomycetota bacterium]
MIQPPPPSAYEPAEIGLDRHALEAPPQVIRTELVERVRRLIERGAYETPERMDKAVQRLLEDL